MVIERGRRRRCCLSHYPPSKSALDGQEINSAKSCKRPLQDDKICRIYKIQDNLFPTININFQHMEISVKRSTLVFLLLLTLLSPSTLSARVLTPQQRSSKPTTTTATAAAPARLPEANL